MITISLFLLIFFFFFDILYIKITIIYHPHITYKTPTILFSLDFTIHNELNVVFCFITIFNSFFFYFYNIIIIINIANNFQLVLIVCNVYLFLLFIINKGIVKILIIIIININNQIYTNVYKI